MPTDSRLDAGKNYKLHLPPNIPVKEFWSVIAYSDQTRSMLQTDQQYPSVGSQTKGLLVNDDGSVDCIADPRLHPTKRRTGCRPSLVKAGTRSYACTVRWSRGSTRLWRPGEMELQPGPEGVVNHVTKATRLAARRTTINGSSGITTSRPPSRRPQVLAAHKGENGLHKGKNWTRIWTGLGYGHPP